MKGNVLQGRDGGKEDIQASWDVKMKDQNFGAKTIYVEISWDILMQGKLVSQWKAGTGWAHE